MANHNGKSAAIVEAENRHVHVTKMPEWMWERLQHIMAEEDRSARNAVINLLQTALVDMQRKGCTTLDEYRKLLGITAVNTAEAKTLTKV